MNKNFKFSDLDKDIISPMDLVRAGFPLSKEGVYTMFNRADFPAVRVGKKLLVTKSNLQMFLEKTK